MRQSFPKNFLWGTATSSHQVEGDNKFNDWWQWESQGKIKNGERSGDACDHFNQFEEDFELAKKLNQNTHRFSLEWSRIEPAEGEFNESAIYHYRKVLESLVRHNLKPMVTLNHFTLPLWIAQKGGWENPEILVWFNRFVRKCVKHFGDLVPFWITINEPMVLFFQSYQMGHWPPGKKGGLKHKKVVQHLIKAHGQAYRTIHEEMDRNNWKGQVGLAVYHRVFHPFRPNFILDRWAAKLRDYLFNTLFLKAIDTGIISMPFAFQMKEESLKGTWDFIGLNYYTREHVKFSLTNVNKLFGVEVLREQDEKNSLNWEVYPEGIYESLFALKKYKKPIYITENGICCEKDKQREQFIISHLKQVQKAIREGVDCRGYFHWSLLDNFEWAEGYGPRFGITHVDRQNQERILRESARLYSEIARTNSI